MGVAVVRLHPNVGVVAPRAPLLNFLEITTGDRCKWSLVHSSALTRGVRN